MPFFRHRQDSLQELYGKRRQLTAELDEAEDRAAWLALSDEELDLADGRRWALQAAALQRALDELDIRILRAELDAGADGFRPD